MKVINAPKIMKLGKVHFVYLSYQGSFMESGKAQTQLKEVLKRHNNIIDSRSYSITKYLDDPNLVGINNVRQQIGVVVKDKVTIPELEYEYLNPGQCIVGRYQLNFFEFKKAWQHISNELELIGNKQHGHAFEVYHNNKFNYRLKEMTIDICIPIE